MLYPIDPDYQGLKFGAFYDPCAQRTNLYIREHRYGSVWNAGPLELRKMEQGSLCEPALSCRPDELQPLFNALWEAGYRPAQLQDKGDVVAAKDEHIEDLRYVMKKLMEPT